MLQNNQTMVLPKFSEKEISILKRYFELNKKYYDQINEELTSELTKHPLWGPMLKMQTPEQQKEQSKRSLELQRAAIYEGKWDEYSADLKMQGAFYAQMNISYSDWYDIIKIYKDFLIPHIKRDFVNSTEDAIIFQYGLSIVIDYAMYNIAEAYFDEKNNVIQKSEQRFKALVQEGSDLVGILDPQGNYLYISAASISILGIAPEEFIGRSVLDFMHPDDAKSTLASLQKVTTENRVILEHYRFQNHKKEWKWMETVLTNMLDNPAVNGIVANSRDITEEKKLRELNRQAYSLARIGSWEVDRVNQIIFWSDEVHKLHETDPKSFLPNLEIAINFYRKDFQQVAQSSIEKCITTQEPFDFEAVLVTAKKKEVWVRVKGNGEFVGGECKRIYGSFQDINSLKESENRLQSISENLPGIIYQYRIHPDGTDSVQYISGAVKQLWCFTANEVMENMNLVWDQIKLGGDIEDVKDSILKSIQTKSRWSVRFKCVTPTGELRTHLGTGTPIFLEDGTIVFNSMVLDITQDSKNEELLALASQMARIGSWELNLIKQDENSHYWSPMVREILEVDDNYNPNLADGLEFFIGESKERIGQAVTALINEGVEYDEELLVRTGKGNERWIRAIGKSETANNKRTKIYGSFQDIHNRKKAEQEKNSLQGTLEKSLNEIYIFDAETLRFNYVNIGALFNLGYSKHEIKALTPLDIKPDFTSTSFKQLVAPLVNNEKDKIIFFTNHKRKDGSLYPVEVHLQLIIEGNNKIFLAIILDITERKKAEESLRISEEKNRLIMNSALDAIVCIDVNGNVTFWNAQAERIFGWKHNELMGKKLSAYIIPENFRKTHDNGMDHYVKTGESKVFNKISELSALNKDGEVFPIELTVIPIKQSNEEFFCAFIRDITERKKAEVKILQSNERFEKVTEATNDAIWDWDIVNQTYYRSKAIENFFGKEASKSFSTSEFWEDNFHPEDLIKVQESIQVAIANPLTTRWEKEYRVFNEQRKMLHVVDRATIIRNNEGKAIRMVGAMTDISEQKQMTVRLGELNKALQKHTSELERSNEELEQFAFVASHDLQEPLRMVYSFMDQLQRKYGDRLDEKGHQYIQFATNGAKKMKQIILDLLEFSKANKPTEGKEEVNLNVVLSEYKLLREHLISEKNASIKSKDLPTLLTYKAVITQILHCLIDNALKYSLQGTSPKVEIDVVENEKEWKFSIKDNGIGINSQFYDKIFIVFQRLHNKDEYAGTGIGLAIAKRHVEFLGGKIWLDSVKGEGTVFYFTISKIK